MGTYNERQGILAGNEMYIYNKKQGALVGKKNKNKLLDNVKSNYFGKYVPYVELTISAELDNQKKVEKELRSALNDVKSDKVVENDDTKYNLTPKEILWQPLKEGQEGINDTKWIFKQSNAYIFKTKDYYKKNKNNIEEKNNTEKGKSKGLSYFYFEVTVPTDYFNKVEEGKKVIKNKDGSNMVIGFDTFFRGNNGEEIVSLINKKSFYYRSDGKILHDGKEIDFSL